MSFILGLSIGLVAMLILHLSVTNSYKRILIMKSKDGTAEYLKGKFYYIMEEKDYNKYSYLKNAGY